MTNFLEKYSSPAGNRRGFDAKEDCSKYVPVWLGREFFQNGEGYGKPHQVGLTPDYHQSTVPTQYFIRPAWHSFTLSLRRERGRVAGDETKCKSYTYQFIGSKLSKD